MKTLIFVFACLLFCEGCTSTYAVKSIDTIDIKKDVRVQLKTSEQFDAKGFKYKQGILTVAGPNNKTYPKEEVESIVLIDRGDGFVTGAKIGMISGTLAAFIYTLTLQNPWGWLGNVVFFGYSLVVGGIPGAGVGAVVGLGIGNRDEYIFDSRIEQEIINNEWRKNTYQR